VAGQAVVFKTGGSVALFATFQSEQSERQMTDPPPALTAISLAVASSPFIEKRGRATARGCTAGGLFLCNISWYIFSF